MSIVYVGGALVIGFFAAVVFAPIGWPLNFILASLTACGAVLALAVIPGKRDTRS